MYKDYIKEELQKHPEEAIYYDNSVKFTYKDREKLRKLKTNHCNF